MGRHRFARQVALHIVAAARFHEMHLFFRFHAFGHHRQVQVLGQVENGVADGRVLARFGQVLDEGAVDLQHGNGKALQVGQRGIAGAEIVDGDARAALRHLAEDGFRVHGIDHQGAFRDFQHQVFARESRKGDGVVEHVEEFIVAELARTDVDGDVQRPPGHFLELLELHAGGLQRPGAQQVDQAIRLGDGDEAHGRHQAQGRVLPAHQGFEALDLPRAGVDDGLVEQQEFAFAHGVEHGRFQRNVVFRRAVQARAVDEAAGLARFLGARHGRIGQRHQAHFVFRVQRVDGHADGGAHVDRVAIDFERRLQGGQQAPRHQLDLRVRGAAGQHGDEFIAAHARQGVAVAQGLAQARRGQAQHGVADGVAQAVVDLLEAIEADGGHRKALARTRRLGDHHADAVRQQQPVWQARERIVRGHVAQAFFRVVLGRRIAPHDQQFGDAGRVHVRRQAQLEPDFLVRRLQAHFQAARFFQGVFQRRLQRRARGLGRERQQQVAGQAAGRAEQAGCALAGKQDQAVRIEAEHDVARLFHEVVQLVASFAVGGGWGTGKHRAGFYLFLSVLAPAAGQGASENSASRGWSAAGHRVTIGTRSTRNVSLKSTRLHEIEQHCFRFCKYSCRA